MSPFDPRSNYAPSSFGQSGEKVTLSHILQDAAYMAFLRSTLLPSLGFQGDGYYLKGSDHLLGISGRTHEYSRLRTDREKVGNVLHLTWDLLIGDEGLMIQLYENRRRESGYLTQGRLSKVADPIVLPGNWALLLPPQGDEWEKRWEKDIWGKVPVKLRDPYPVQVDSVRWAMDFNSGDGFWEYAISAAVGPFPQTHQLFREGRILPHPRPSTGGPVVTDARDHRLNILEYGVKYTAQIVEEQRQAVEARAQEVEAERRRLEAERHRIEEERTRAPEVSWLSATGEGAADGLAASVFVYLGRRFRQRYEKYIPEILKKEDYIFPYLICCLVYAVPSLVEIPGGDMLKKLAARGLRGTATLFAANFTLHWQGLSLLVLAETEKLSGEGLAQPSSDSLPAPEVSNGN